LSKKYYLLLEKQQQQKMSFPNVSELSFPNFQNNLILKRKKKEKINFCKACLDSQSVKIKFKEKVKTRATSKKFVNNGNGYNEQRGNVGWST